MQHPSFPEEISNPDSASPALAPPSPQPPPPDNGAAPQTESPTGTATPSDSPTDTEGIGAVRRERNRVRFNSNAATMQPPTIPPPWNPSSSSSASSSRGHELNSTTPGSAGPAGPARPANLAVPRPRPSVLRSTSDTSIPRTGDFDPHPQSEKALSAVAAHERARQIADNLRRERRNASSDSRVSQESHASGTPSEGLLLRGHDDIPLEDMSRGRGVSRHDHESTGILVNHHHNQGQDDAGEQSRTSLRAQAYKLVQSHSSRYRKDKKTPPEAGNDTPENQPPQTPETQHVVPREVNDGSWDGVYNVPAPDHYRKSVLSQLLTLYRPGPELPVSHSRQSSASMAASRHDEEAAIGGQSRGSASNAGSESATPRRKWYDQNRSQDTLANLIEASARLANPNLPPPSEASSSAGHHHGGRKWTNPMLGHGHKHGRSPSRNRLSAMIQKEEARITVHIAETLFRQQYIIKLCRALMLYGAPTHRLEEFLSTSARVLGIEGQFLYLPGCMVISFDDRSTHTTEMRIVRSAQGIDLGKLKDVHLIYKEVMHDVIGVEEGTERLDRMMDSPDKFNPWLRVLIFGLTSAASAPFSFKARLIDLPLSFCFGCLVGFLQLIVSPKSKLYSNVFEVSAVVVVSFLARAFGSIAGGSLFCFSAITQGGIVMLLPGYLVLCSSLELQSRAIVPGSIRIVYAIIYSLLLGFGITVGASLYGLFDNDAISETTCRDPMDAHVAFAFVPPFVLCICMLYQAKWRQMPVMILIAFAGYIVNFFSGRKFAASPQVASTLGAVAVGLLANLYSRLRHGVAAATLIPAIFTQVPGGLASTGGLLSGISTANMLNGANSTDTTADQGEINTVVFNVAASMIQIAIGIAVGLFISALAIYPLGKRRSGLFSF